MKGGGGGRPQCESEGRASAQRQPWPREPLLVPGSAQVCAQVALRTPIPCPAPSFGGGRDYQTARTLDLCALLRISPLPRLCAAVHKREKRPNKRSFSPSGCPRAALRAPFPRPRPVLTLSATIYLLFFSLARYTLPNLPRPSGFPMSKSLSIQRRSGSAAALAAAAAAALGAAAGGAAAATFAADALAFSLSMAHARALRVGCACTRTLGTPARGEGRGARRGARRAAELSAHDAQRLGVQTPLSRLSRGASARARGGAKPAQRAECQRPNVRLASTVTWLIDDCPRATAHRMARCGASLLPLHPLKRRLVPYRERASIARVDGAASAALGRGLGAPCEPCAGDQV